MSRSGVLGPLIGKERSDVFVVGRGPGFRSLAVGACSSSNQLGRDASHVAKTKGGIQQSDRPAKAPSKGGEIRSRTAEVGVQLV